MPGRHYNESMIDFTLHGPARPICRGFAAEPMAATSRGMQLFDTPRLSFSDALPPNGSRVASLARLACRRRCVAAQRHAGRGSAKARNTLSLRRPRLLTLRHHAYIPSAADIAARQRELAELRHYSMTAEVAAAWCRRFRPLLIVTFLPPARRRALRHLRRRRRAICLVDFIS